MNRAYFFGRVRDNLFSGKLSTMQLDGLTKILDYREAKWPAMSDDELAYLLATTKWETAHKMQPITELGSDAYLKAKPYWPWIGRGLVQITWQKNYEKFGVTNATDALKWPVALDIIFRGMIYGMFTGKKLSDYIGDGKLDYVGARRIINGTDKAQQIALIATGFRDALIQANKAPVSVPGNPPPVPADTDQTTGKSMAGSTTVWSQIGMIVTSIVVPLLGAANDWKVMAVLGVVATACFGIWTIYQRYLLSKNEGV